MSDADRRGGPDRRRIPRGGRRPYDKPGRYPTVLVADSFDVVRRSCARYLDHLNFEVTQATTHEDIETLVAMSSPRLIVAAMRLRGGGATARWKDARSFTIPMIVITNGEQAGVPAYIADGVLRRPFTPSEMIEEVRRVLRVTEGQHHTGATTITNPARLVFSPVRLP